jgi:hypothetical protein
VGSLGRRLEDGRDAFLDGPWIIAVGLAALAAASCVLLILAISPSVGVDRRRAPATLDDVPGVRFRPRMTAGIPRSLGLRSDASTADDARCAEITAEALADLSVERLAGSPAGFRRCGPSAPPTEGCGGVAAGDAPPYGGGAEASGVPDGARRQ